MFYQLYPFKFSFICYSGSYMMILVSFFSVEDYDFYDNYLFGVFLKFD